MPIFMKPPEAAGDSKFQHGSRAGYERQLKATAIAGDGAVLSGSRGGWRRGARLVVERGRDIADADDADHAVIVEHRHVPDVVLVHEMTNVFERIGRTAGNQLLHRNQLRDLQIDAGRAMLGNRADHVAFGEHADRGIAFGPHHILDPQRADIAGAHPLGGNGDGLVHANRCNAGSFLAQDVSDLHRNLLQVSRRTSSVPPDWYTLSLIHISEPTRLGMTSYAVF